MTRPIVRTLVLLLSAVALIAVPTAQAQDMQSESRDVSAFSRLVLSTPGTVYLTQGDTPSLRVEASRRNLLDRVRTRVDGDVLIIDTEPGEGRGWFGRLFGDDGELRIYVTMTDVRSLSVNGTGDIVAETILTAEEIEFNVAGTGDIGAEVDVDYLESAVNGTGDIELRGRATRHRIRISGTGDVEAIDLQTEETDIKISGTGDARVHATRSLRASVSGLGDVTYRGAPDDVDVNTSGLGDVEREDG